MIHHPNRLCIWFQIIRVQLLNPTEPYLAVCPLHVCSCLFLTDYVCISTDHPENDLSKFCDQDQIKQFQTIAFLVTKLIGTNPKAYSATSPTYLSRQEHWSCQITLFSLQTLICIGRDTCC